ncbi:hypothetical protein CAE01nite_15230 [Cellulomonas aerilata]|uniref:Uncharacterized protein n=1 Tax=Cellulomonas aerilata TaxID=515326 RepID=A0A512DBE8_9CELL|nr:hypothetical protein CAE01nite_15230 [Cellulomonas aerilata]
MKTTMTVMATVRETRLSCGPDPDRRSGVRRAVPDEPGPARSGTAPPFVDLPVVDVPVVGAVTGRPSAGSP